MRKIDSELNIFEDKLNGRPLPLTDFGKVCDKLGIKQIFAYSAQAKGRVERKHQLYQDRMVKEIKLFKLKTMAEVNDFLLRSNGFIQKPNLKFTIPATEGDSSIRLLGGELDAYFTIDENRIVRNDYTILFKKQTIQLDKHPRLATKAKVTVKTYLNGTITVFLDTHKLTHQVLVDYIKPAVETQVKSQNLNLAPKAKTMPWRNFNPKKSSTAPNKINVQKNLD